MEQLITSSYEHKLACVYHKIDNRGLLMNGKKLAKLRHYCTNRVLELCTNINANIGRKIYVGALNKPADDKTAVNINYSPNLQTLLKDLGFTLPKIRARNKETSEYEFKDSASKIVLQKVLANPELWPASMNTQAEMIIKSLLEIHQVEKIKTTYVNARLYHDTYYSNYNVAGTVTGRRGSKKHIFNLGNNAQNFPKHSELAARYLESIISRPGCIFFSVDQISAEDWPVQALAENYSALEEMKSGINRHYRFASIIFGVPVDTIKAGRAREDFTSEMQYYLGKKSRHANNYGMRAPRMSESLAAEGFSYSKDFCQVMLDKVNNADPNVDKVFHQYIKTKLFSPEHKLVTPLGRERQFLGLRPNDKNYELLNEAYSYIPQSYVGDNTGLAVLFLDGNNPYVVHEGHDSICQEVPDDENELLKVFKDTRSAFNRPTVFHNGITINIPIEGELGYDFHHKVKLKQFTPEGLLTAYKEVKEMKLREKDATSSEEVMA